MRKPRRWVQVGARDTLVASLARARPASPRHRQGITHRERGTKPSSPPGEENLRFSPCCPSPPSPWRRRTLASGPAGSPELPPRDANVAAGGNAATADAGNDFTGRTGL